MVYAADSKSAAFTGLGVQVSSPARHGTMREFVNTNGPAARIIRTLLGPSAYYSFAVSSSSAC
jgi:hypothetical protein